MAPNGRGMMSELSPLSRAKRKSGFGAVRAAFDLRRTIGKNPCYPTSRATSDAKAEHLDMAAARFGPAWGRSLTFHSNDRFLVSLAFR
jgi:hypothetical protein